MDRILPEKVNLLVELKKGNFNVPDFIYVTPEEFHNQDFDGLKAFLENHTESFKVIARSAHIQEDFFKGGTFDSLETYADIAGIEYARNKIISMAKNAKRLSILRQQVFNYAPTVEYEQMGILVMPFVEGTSVMAKLMGDHWEFGYCQDRSHKVQRDPYITNTPHDRRLVQISKEIQLYLGFRCEIEYIVSEMGEIYVVQAKDIARFDLAEIEEAERSIRLDGVRRIRKRKNYRERPIYVMDNKEFYIQIISKCEDLLWGGGTPKPTIEEILDIIRDYERGMEEFAVLHERFGVLGLSIRDPKELYQVAAHYLDEDFPDLQKKLSKALHANLYKLDYFLSEADTLIAKDKFRINLCSHDAYGIDNIRNPLWSLYWYMERHEQVVRECRELNLKTGDAIAIDIDPDEKPTMRKL